METGHLIIVCAVGTFFCVLGLTADPHSHVALKTVGLVSNIGGAVLGAVYCHRARSVRNG